MVALYLLLSMLLFPFLSCAQELTIDMQLEPGNHYENTPLSGTILITHRKNETIDTRSFHSKGKPFSVDYVKDQPINSEYLLSVFHFDLPGQPKGLYVLPEVSVKINNKTYRSSPSTYEVIAGTGLASVGNKEVLKFEAAVDGSQNLYPGEHTRFLYRYIYSDSVELTQEVLPLLEAAGMKKIGALQVKDYGKGSLSVREISQEVEAVKPGTFKYGPSFVTGYVYRLDPFGSRMYQKPAINIEIAPLIVTVQPFPEAGKPASFNGAVGPFETFKVELKSSPTLSIDDKLILSVSIGGEGQVSNVPLPELCCQPGFSGKFSLGDLPPAEEVQGTTKSFQVELRPQSTSIKEIPPIEFSFFIPSTKQYGVLRSRPIPITVLPLPKQNAPSEHPVEEPAETARPMISNKPVPIEIERHDIIRDSDLNNYFFGQWWVLFLIPLGVIIILPQITWRDYLREKKPQARKVTAADLLNVALNIKIESPAFSHLLSRALMTRLVEKGIIPNPDIPLEKLPDIEEANLVRTFLTNIEEKKFSGIGGSLDPNIAGEAKALFKKL